MNRNSGLLREMVTKTPTELWNDSCSVKELQFSMENGAVGATTNPVIVGNVLQKEMDLWEERIRNIVASNPRKNEVDLTWKLIEEMAINGARLLKPVFDEHKGKKGRISVQTNPQNYMSSDLMTEQALYLSSLAPNIQVKIPVTRAGLETIEEITYNGVHVNATVCFSVPQSIAAAEAVERGLSRRKHAGKEVANMHPVCTIMVGRLDDWLKTLAKKEETVIDPGYLEWAGIAVVKRAYKIFHDRRYQTKLLVGAFRNFMQWNELLGGDLIITATHEWQQIFDRSALPIKNNIDTPVDPRIVSTLEKSFDDFKKAYDPAGMREEAFDQYGATRRTLRQFLSGYQDLISKVRDFMLSNPDL